MKKGRVLNMCCLITIMTIMIGGIPAMYAQAYSAKVSYVFEGIDLDLGAVEVDPTILVVTMGETVDDMLSPSRSYLDDFSPGVDLSFDFHSASTQTMTVMLHHAVKVAMIADVAFQEFDHTVLDSLEFLEGQHTVSFPVDTCLIVWTAEDQFFKLHLRDLGDFSVELECIKLPSVTSVPELSTGFLVGVGLVVISRIIGRNKHRSLALGAFVLLCFGGASMVSAQSSSITVVKVTSNGDGTLLYGDTQCPPGCQHMTFPYQERTGVVLKAIPDEHSRFVRWKTAQQTFVEGNLKAHAGETIFAIFQDKYALFTDDPSQPESPELYEAFFLRGRYVRLFPEILLQEERVVLNLFDDVSVTAIRERFTEEAEQYTWSGSVPDKLSLITLSIHKPSLSVTGRIWVDGLGQYSIHSHSDNVQLIFEIDQSFFDKTSTLSFPVYQSSLKSSSNQSILRKWVGIFIEKIVSLFTIAEAYAQSTPVIDVMVLYTPATKAFSSHQGDDIEVQIKDAIKDTNNVYIRSGINLQLNLAHTQELEGYQEQPTIVTLNQLCHINLDNDKEISVYSKV